MHSGPVLQVCPFGFFNEHNPLLHQPVLSQSAFETQLFGQLELAPSQRYGAQALLGFPAVPSGAMMQ